MQKTLIVGLDACFWDVLEKADNQNKIPTITSHIENGYTATLESSTPAITTPAWKVMYTGKNPGRLGVFGHRIGEWGGENWIPLQHDFKSADFWDYLNEYREIETAIISGVNTYPPRELDGIMIPDAWTNPGIHPYPQSEKEDLEERGYELSTYTSKELKNGNLKNAKETLNIHYGTAKHYLNDNEVVMLVTNATDKLEHVYLSEKPVIELYSHIDSLLAKIESEHPDINVVIVSDHGMKSGAEKVIWINTWLKKRGYMLEMQGETADTTRATLRKVWQHTPELGKDIVRHVLNAADTKDKIRGFVGTDYDVDWESSDAVYWTPGIRLHESREDLAKEIVEAFEKDFGHLYPDELKPLLRSSNIYEGDFVNEAPELMFNPYVKRYIRIRGGRQQDVLTDASEIKWNHEHDPIGVFIADGPLYDKSNNRGDAKITDVMPTILASYGIEVKSGIDGQILSSCLADNSTEKVSELPTPDLSDYVDEYMPEREKHTKKAEERLKKLGYLE